MKTFKEICKWALFIALGLTALFAGMIILGESDTLTSGEFLWGKMSAIAVIYSVYRICKKLYQKDLLPRFIMDDINENLNEEV